MKFRFPKHYLASDRKNAPPPEANFAKPLMLVGRVLQVCLLASGVRLAEENEPQDEEVNQNKDKAQAGNRDGWSDHTGNGADQFVIDGMFASSHFCRVECLNQI